MGVDDVVRRDRVRVREPERDARRGRADRRGRRARRRTNALARVGEDGPERVAGLEEEAGPLTPLAPEQHSRASTTISRPRFDSAFESATSAATRGSASTPALRFRADAGFPRASLAAAYSASFAARSRFRSSATRRAWRYSCDRLRSSRLAWSFAT